MDNFLGRNLFMVMFIQVGFENTMYLIAKILFGLCIAYTTNFVPDEFWQSTEVAYQFAFGKGHLTWESMVGIRSTIMPVFLAVIYKLGSFVGLSNNPLFLTLVPQVLQALLSLKASMFFFQFCALRMGFRVARLAFMFFLVNWFVIYCSARTITNQTEMSLNIMGLWYLQSRQYPKFVLTLVINFMIRPTAAIFWIPFISEIIYLLSIRQIIVLSILGLIPFVAGTAIDMLVYDRWTLTWWEFFKFNIVNNGNEEFGVHPNNWYMYSALPSILGPLYVFFPVGFFCIDDTRRLSFYLLVFITILSSIGHKEIRFLLPVLPLVFLVIASVVDKLMMYCENFNVLGAAWKRVLVKNLCVFVLLVSNIIAITYFGVFHLRGFRNIAIQVNWLTAEMETTPEIWIMTPCYSMPVHTFIADERANYMYYICPPERFSGLYDLSTNSSLIYQKGSFHEQNIERDIKMKVRSRGPPDNLITYEDYVKTIEDVQYEMGYYYMSIMYCRHTYLGNFSRFVHLIARVDKNKVDAYRQDRKAKEFFREITRNITPTFFTEEFQ